tara:strand:+ start:2952 stop:3470 length:519 start_codon:yes stop_codon:yes gene_type:complete
MKKQVIYILGAIAIGLFLGNVLTKVEESTPKVVSPFSIIDEIDTIHISRGTYYNPVSSQCDASPLITADGSYIDTNELKSGTLRYVALSWDLINDAYRRKVAFRKWAWNGKIKFGDTISVHSIKYPQVNGKWVVRDVMNSRYRKTVDFLYAKSSSPRIGVINDLKIIIKKKI